MKNEDFLLFLLLLYFSYINLYKSLSLSLSQVENITY